MNKIKSWMIFLFSIIPYFPFEHETRILLFIGWMVAGFIIIYWLAAELHKALPVNKKFNLRLLNVCLTFTTAYMIFIQIKMGGGYEITNENYKEFGNDIYWLIPSHLFVMFALIYSLFTMTAAITRLIYPEPRRRWLFIKTGLKIIFLPIGVWFFWPELMEAMYTQREQLPS